MREFTRLAKAMGNATRVRILKLLQERELCVCHIQDIIGGAQSTISKHLGILRDVGLVTCRKEGLWTYYRLETEARRGPNLAFLALIANELDDNPQIKQDIEALLQYNDCCNASETHEVSP